MGLNPTISTQSLPPAQPTGSGSTGDLLRRSAWTRFAVPLLALAVASTFAGFEVARHLPSRWASADLVQAATLPAAAASNAAIAPAQPLSLEAISRLAPQSQAEHLLERAIARDFESLDAINKKLPLWRGQLRNTDHLYDLVHTALNSDDMRVRSSAIEINLAAYNIDKTPDSVARLVQQLHADPDDRTLALWQLGALGNRGIEQKLVLAQLLHYVHDRSEVTRYWAVEGLALLGSGATVDPLLDRFAHDPSARVRKRAGCNLAKTGMLTKEQRLAAVPELLNLFDDDGLDVTTRSWVYGALRLITGAELGNDANAWRQWWANRTTAHKKPVLHNQLLFA
ncbi:MAG: HEAT repeat domain-containing protein [Acidobacteria bacterium]|nr:HEAT repeat domain-containing protein [Acidobacteriota bacterium]